jgi:hypothetical protein
MKKIVSNEKNMNGISERILSSNFKNWGLSPNMIMTKKDWGLPILSLNMKKISGREKRKKRLVKIFIGKRLSPKK